MSDCPSSSSSTDEPSALTIHCCSLLDGEVSEELSAKYSGKSNMYIAETELDACCSNFPADACTTEGSSTKLNREKRDHK